MKDNEQKKLNSLDYDERSFIGKGENYLIHQVEGFDIMYSKIHEHNFSEIFFLLSGDVTYSIEEGKIHLKQYDCLFVPPHTLHQIIVNDKNTNYRRIVLWIYPKYLDEISTSLTNLNKQLVEFTDEGNYLIRDLDFSFHFKNILEEILSLQEEKRYGYDLLVRNKISEIFISISRYLSEQSKIKEKTETNSIISKVIEYINNNIDKELKIVDLAKIVNLDSFYLSHLFTKETGVTLHQFVIKKRLTKTKKMLDDGYNIKDIAPYVGFKDSSHLIQAFKKEYGMTPLKYKQLSEEK